MKVGSRRVSKHSTVDELLDKMAGSSDKFEESLSDKGIRILRKGKDIKSKAPTELYLNETELKQAGIEFLKLLKNCKILYTDNMALRVGNGRKVKTRNPGMADHHICLRGLFIAIEAKMPGKDLEPDQVTYKNEVLSSMGKFIVYHSVYELETEMINQKLISRRLFKNG